MSLHGLKKAVARLPQQFSTSASDLPPEIQQLEHRLDLGAKALDVLISQTKAYADNLIGLLDSSTGFLLSSDKDVKELSLVRTAMLQSIEANKHRIIKPSQDMKQYLAQVNKVIAKRNRKKLDCDRFSAALKKHGEAAPAIASSPAHLKKVNDGTADLNKANDEYTLQNTILAEQLPKVITILDKFLKSMLSQEHAFQMTSLQSLKAHFEPYALQSHIAATPESLQTDAIVSAWRSSFVECKEAAEVNIYTIKMSKVPTMSMQQTSIPTRAVVGGGANATKDESSLPKPALPSRPQEQGSSAGISGPPPAYDGPAVAPVDHKQH